jgi:hypothetical protein
LKNQYLKRHFCAKHLCRFLNRLDNRELSLAEWRKRSRVAKMTTNDKNDKKLQKRSEVAKPYIYFHRVLLLTTNRVLCKKTVLRQPSLKNTSSFYNLQSNSVTISDEILVFRTSFLPTLCKYIRTVFWLYFVKLPSVKKHLNIKQANFFINRAQYCASVLYFSSTNNSGHRKPHPVQANVTSNFLATLQHCRTSFEKKYPARPTLVSILWISFGRNFYDKTKRYKGQKCIFKTNIFMPLHPPQDQTTMVRIPPGYYIFREN